jgi:hypothetical protein
VTSVCVCIGFRVGVSLGFRMGFSNDITCVYIYRVQFRAQFWVCTDMMPCGHSPLFGVCDVQTCVYICNEITCVHI